MMDGDAKGRATSAPAFFYRRRSGAIPSCFRRTAPIAGGTRYHALKLLAQQRLVEPPVAGMVGRPQPDHELSVVTMVPKSSNSISSQSTTLSAVPSSL